MMTKHHPDNERVKRRYFVFLKEAKRQNEASVDAVAKSISRFEQYTSWRDFKAFHFEQAVGFKAHLAKSKNQKTGAALSKATLNSTLRALKAFFHWLSMQPGYRSRLNYTEAEYFNLSQKDARIATAKRDSPVPTLEQIRYAIALMPNSSAIERRNRALLAFTLLTGARDSAMASFKLKHLDLESGFVFQDAREVKTKASKTFTSYFFPVGADILEIVQSWADFLLAELLFGLNDPLFPKTEVKPNASRVFEPVGLSRDHWSNASPIRGIFKAAFEQAGLPYFNPHSFRKTLVRLGETTCHSPEEFKAWSQNLGHQGVLTTFYSYGEVQASRQSEIFKALRTPRDRVQYQEAAEIAAAVVKAMNEAPARASRPDD
jgi:integrase/recombinase XerD